MRMELAAKKWGPISLAVLRPPAAIISLILALGALALATVVCFQFRLNLPAPTCLYLIVIVVTSIRSHFLSSAIVSIVAAFCLDYYFLPPIFSLELRRPEDYVALTAFLTTSTVITQLVSRVRQLLQEKLLRSEAYLSEAQQLSHTGSFGWKVSTGELVWSEETFRIFQYDPARKPNLALVLQRVYPDDAALVKQTIERAAQDGKDFDFQHRLFMPDGSVKHIRVVAHAGSDAAGKPEFVGAVMDMTERKHAEEALQHAQAELVHITRITIMGELTASIAHEVSQPLTAMVNNANACLTLLPADAPNLQEVRATLSEITDEADRAVAILHRIRKLMKKAPVERTLLDLRDVITEVVALSRHESTKRRTIFRIELPKDLPPVLGDRVQLQQVLLNLVVNGMDAMNAVEESKRILTIGTRRETRDGKSAILLSVQDAGTGFKPEEMNRLFKAFHTTKPHGMGMGLAISRSIIEAHGGRLWAEPNQGPGATFLFSLPAANHGIP